MNQLYRFFFLLGMTVLLFNVEVNAQLQVTPANVPPFTPENLIENIFLGEGTEVFSVTYTGDPAAIGFFNGENSNIGIDRGVLMTSGFATNAIGPNDANGTTGNNTGGTDPDLASISAVQIGDASVYEIVFSPFADTLRFEYVFASEEYEEFTCQDFNDAFGFFITGGTEYPVATNIALIPGTTTPVTINTVNQGGITNSDCPDPTPSPFYISNLPLNTDPMSVEYDGFTTVLVAEAIVTPCETYTLKLAIGDGGDQLLDSGVFLKANSFGTPGLFVEVETVSPDSTIAEGCIPATISFGLEEPLDDDFVLDYSISGTAINGVDYDFVPPVPIIPAGTDSINLVFRPINDNIMEGIETIDIDVQINPCERDTFTLYITDNELPEPDVLDVSYFCGDTISLDATLPITLPSSTTFSNNTPFSIPDNDVFNPAVSTINVGGVIPEVLAPGVIFSVCVNIDHVWDGDVDIFLVTPGGQFLELSTDNGGSGDDYTNTCFTEIATMDITNTIANSAPFTGDWLPEGPWTDIYGGPTNGTYQLLVSDDTNGFEGTLLNWSITFPPIYSLSYEWVDQIGLSDPLSPITDVFITDTTSYIVFVNDTYGCQVSDTVFVNVEDIPPPINISCDNSVLGEITFGWDQVSNFNNYEVSIDGGPWITPSGTLEHTVNGLALGQTVNFEVRVLRPGCGASSGSLSCDAINCTFNSSVVNQINVSCNGGSDGVVSVVPQNGFPPYTYTLNGTTQATGDFSG
ncbi:MAG: choice-of-anchor L domain-containing protein, partial [Bacteroidota bacterium]